MKTAPAGIPEAVITHAQEEAQQSGHTVHVCRLPESKALFPFALVAKSDFRFEREKWRPLEACAVTRYGRIIEAQSCAQAAGASLTGRVLTPYFLTPARCSMLDALPVATDHDWTPERIKDLRSALGMTQAEFGQYVYDHSTATAQNQISRLENGDRSPGAAARATLNRLAEQAKQDHS